MPTHRCSYFASIMRAFVVGSATLIISFWLGMQRNPEAQGISTSILSATQRFAEWCGNALNIYMLIARHVGNAGAVIACIILICAVVALIVIIDICIDICIHICSKYATIAVSQFFTFRTVLHSRSRAKYAKAAMDTQFIYTTKASMAFATTGNDILTITDLYNCLVDQQMISAVQLQSAIPDIRIVYAKFDNNIGATIDIDRAEATIHWYNNTNIVTAC